MQIHFTNEKPEYSGRDLMLGFMALVNGERVQCQITAEALEDHFGAQSALEADLRDAFERGRARIEAACAEVLADGGGADVVLHSGYFRAPGGRARAGLFGPGKS